MGVRYVDSCILHAYVLTELTVAFHSVDELEDEVANALVSMRGGNVDDEDATIPLAEILEWLNKNRHPGRKDRVSRQQLENVLLALEEQNKVMYIRDGDDPVVMLV